MMTKQTAAYHISYAQYILRINTQEQLPFVLADKAGNYRGHTEDKEHQLGSGRSRGAKSTAGPDLESSL